MGVDLHGVFQRRTSTGWDDVETHYDERRDYLLFAWLGNQCNGRDSTVVRPLSNDRGYPSDFVVTSNGRYDGRWNKDKNMGERNHSWLSVDEILAVDAPKSLRSGVVDRKFFDSWDGVRPPESTQCAGDVGGAVVKCHPSEVTAHTTHVRIEWFEEGARIFKYFIDEARRLKEQHGDVRFVFGFDG